MYTLRLVLIRLQRRSNKPYATRLLAMLPGSLLLLWLSTTTVASPILYLGVEKDHRESKLARNVISHQENPLTADQLVLATQADKEDVPSLLTHQAFGKVKQQLNRRSEGLGQKWYRKLREKLWSAESRRRCMRRKVGSDPVKSFQNEHGRGSC